MRIKPAIKNSDAYSIMSLFDDFINSFNQDNVGSDSRLMPMDIVEFEDFYKIKANMPGVNKEDISISLKENQLTIETSEREHDIDEQCTVHRKERYSGIYRRVVQLPVNTSNEGISAKLEFGVLTLNIPKSNQREKTEISID